jgi:uncharacterized repeat protein (TIGR01451 family)
MSAATTGSASARSVLARYTGGVILALSVAVVALAAGAVGAGAASGVSWTVEAKSVATDFRPGGKAVYEVDAWNVGTAPTTEVTVSDELPAGVEFKSVALHWSRLGRDSDLSEFSCAPPSGQLVRCTIPSIVFELVGGPFEPGQSVQMVIEGMVSPSAAEGVVRDEGSAEGAGASSSSSAQSMIGSHPEFGIASFTVDATERTEEIFSGEDEGQQEYEFVNRPYATPFTQAGGHPWAATATAEFATEISPHNVPVAVRDVKDIVNNLPPGLLGDPLATPRCPLAHITSGAGPCPADTQIGDYRLKFFGEQEYVAPIVNVVPEAGQSAEFALENSIPVLTPLLTAHLVRRVEDGVEHYGFAVISKSIPLASLEKFELTFWGVPADPSHNPMRGRFCAKQETFGSLICESGGEGTSTAPVPFLSWPTDCTGGPERTTLRVDSWQEPGSIGLDDQYVGYTQDTVAFPAPTGCDQLQFRPGTGIGLEPDTQLADEPVGLGIDLRVPQSEAPGSLLTPLLRDTRVTLPEGMSVSPGVVDGIQACNATGPEGINITGPESEVVGEDGDLHLAPGHCPDASIVGTAEAITPYLPVPVKGHVYLARPGCGGAGQAACTDQDALDGNLYKLYLELGGAGELADSGIEFKVPFDTEANPATGQITANVSELVQAPYSEVRIHLNGGPRAPLANPAACGQAVTTADLTPWSAPGRIEEPGGPSNGLLATGTPDSLSSSFFEVTRCASPTPFAPGFVAGTVTPQAGQFSSFTMNLSRSDREQDIKGIQIHTPPGLLALLSSVPLCPEDQANEPSVYGECTASKIGTTRVASGAGSHPFEIEGSVYLTGPHDGAPFGLSIVTHAVAGPFNLGLIVVRARIDIDPENSTATITTDETGPYAVPQIVFGVPLRLQRITVDIDRPAFMFNPTRCTSQQITAVISGSEEARASVSSPFAVAGCQSLAFKPAFAVSTSGHTSRAGGASLDVKLSYPAGSLGREANIASVKVELPRQLPSRLTTLQKACTAATFEANPADCPQESVVGVVKATTPLLPVGLSGPAYFVSHGGESFPSLIVVLEGDGVRVDLTGSTFINGKTGVTSSTFKTVPDVPVGTFELYLPEGRYSALAANASLCNARGKLKMPTEFVAQNGMTLKQNTSITVTGCAKARTRTTRTSRHRARTSRRERRAHQGRTGHGRTHR